MDAAALATITDIDTLRGVIREQIDTIAQRDATIATRDRAIVHKEARIEVLTHEIARLRRVQFTAKSERMDPDQRTLFDESMAADIAAVESELEALRSTPTATVTATRKTPQRRALPADLPPIETRHEPQSCNCGTCGAALVAIGEHVSETAPAHPALARPCASKLTASRSSSSCAATSIRSTPAAPARPSSPNPWRPRSSNAGWRLLACSPRS